MCGWSVNTPKIEQAVGHPIRAYKSTVRALHLLLKHLNKMQIAGKLPDDNELTTRLVGAMMAVELFKRHFPEYDLDGTDGEL